MNNDPLHEQAEEQVLDYFLHELISGQSPPDLSQHITAAWSREQAESTDAVTRSPSVQRSVQAQPIAVGHSVVARPLHSGTTANNSIEVDSQGRGISLRRQVIASLLATGACGLLVLLSWQLADPDLVLAQRMLEFARAEVRNLANPPIVPPAPPVQPASDTTPPSLAASPAASGGLPEPATTSQIAAGDSPQTPTPSEESIALFPLDQRSTANESSRTGTSPPDALQANTGKSATGGAAMPLDGQQIVTQIDKRLASVWHELSVAPSPKFDDAQRARQVSLALTGQPPSGAVDDLDALISEATASLPFARQWAEQFVGVWLAGSNLPTDDARVETLNRYFAEYIYEGRPWNATALELLGGSLPTTPLEERKSDERKSGDAEQGLAISADQLAPDAGLNPVASAFVSALAGDGNHRLVSHIGTNFLNLNLSCARCHDVNSPSLAAQWSATAQDTEHAVGRQAAYWALTAMLQGIDTHVAESGKRVVVDRQAELLAAGKPLTAYYDLIDGRLQAVEPRLPDGQTWETITNAGVPRQALAQWLSQSPAMDEATVNQVWCMIFGQPLVPHAAARLDVAVDGQPSTQSAEQQQRELLELLSTQYRAHGHDLKQLVGWIVRSDAFRRQPLRPTHAQWLAASQDELRQWRLGRGSFANGARPTTGAGSSQSLKTSLALVLQWRERSNADEETTLAQPVPNLAPTPASALDSVSKTLDSKASVGASELDDRLRLAPPSAAELAFVDRLLASQRLSWKDHVEHIVCLAPEVLADKRIHSLADRLLRQHKGDARAALLDLLWAVKR